MAQNFRNSLVEVTTSAPALLTAGNYDVVIGIMLCNSDSDDNICMMNEKKDEKALSQIMEEMTVDWGEFRDMMPTSYEVYNDGRDEDVRSD